jgi:hypothetical protein
LALALTTLHNIYTDILLSQHLANRLNLHVCAGSQQAKSGDQERPRQQH